MDVQNSTSRKSLEPNTLVIDRSLSVGEAIGIPAGTTHLVGGDGSIILVPTPSKDPADPLNWSSTHKWLIVMLLVAWCGSGLAVQSFIANVLPSAAEKFPDVSESQLNLLVTVVSPLVAPGELLFVPLTITYGRRFALLLSIVILLAATVWGACATSYSSLLGARVLQGFSTGPTDAIIYTIVQDMTFQHERGVMLGVAVNAQYILTYIYPIIIPFMGNDVIQWAFVMFSAVIGLSLIGLFFVMPETRYNRDLAAQEEITLAEHKMTRSSYSGSREYPAFGYARQIRLWNGAGTGPDSHFFNIFKRMGFLLLEPVIWWIALLNTVITG